MKHPKECPFKVGDIVTTCYRVWFAENDKHFDESFCKRHKRPCDTTEYIVTRIEVRDKHRPDCGWLIFTTNQVCNNEMGYEWFKLVDVDTSPEPLTRLELIDLD